MITFILGGAKSGKSAFALDLAEALPGRRAFVATAQALDEEMALRIENHKKERQNRWDTFEEPIEIGKLLRSLCQSYGIVLIDCLTLWISNLIFDNRDVQRERLLLAESLKAAHCDVFIVSNEIGLGIVPDNPLARQFRDDAGALNKEIAAISEHVYFVLAGVPIKIK